MCMKGDIFAKDNCKLKELNVYRFADKLERISFVGNGVLMNFASFDVSAGDFTPVVSVRVSLAGFLQMAGVFEEFHKKFMAQGGAADSVPAVPKQEEAAADEPVRPKRRAKRRKAAAE